MEHGTRVSPLIANHRARQKKNKDKDTIRYHTNVKKDDTMTTRACTREAHAGIQISYKQHEFIRNVRSPSHTNASSYACNMLSNRSLFMQ